MILLKTCTSPNIWRIETHLVKKPYRGINLFTLFLLAFHVHIGCPSEAKGKGGRINKGEKGFPVVFWKWGEVEDLDSEFREETWSAPKVLHHF